MLTTVALFLAGMLAVLAVALWVADRASRASLDPDRPGLIGRVERLTKPLGWMLAPVAIVAVGWLLTVGIMLPVGKLAGALETSVDKPVFDWTSDHLGPSKLCVRYGSARADLPRCKVQGDNPALPLKLNQHGAWHRLNQLATGMGNTRQIRAFVIVASIALAALWWRKAFWVPPLFLGATYLTEYFTQIFLKKTISRGHPPTTLGTFPSGGCARLVCVYGMALVLVLLARRGWSRRTLVIVWTALALAAYVEAFSRVILLKHWFTDVPAGLLFGTLLLTVFGTAAVVLTRGFDGRGPLAARIDDVVREPA